MTTQPTISDVTIWDLGNHFYASTEVNGVRVVGKELSSTRAAAIRDLKLWIALELRKSTDLCDGDCRHLADRYVCNAIAIACL